MAIGDPEVVQPTGNLQHLVGQARVRQPEHIFNNAAALHPRQRVFHDHAHTGEYRIEVLLTDAQLPPARLFLGW